MKLRSQAFQGTNSVERSAENPRPLGRGVVKIYVVMVEDRHTDTEAHLFSTPEKAISFAQSVLDANSESAEYVDDDDARMSEEDLREAGWLFYGCYSTEGDCVWVLPSDVDAS